MRINRVQTLARRAAWFVLALQVLPSVLSQSVPAAINYQGKLYDPSANSGAGGPITGVQQVEFRIYDSLTQGTLIWGRSFPVNCTSEGVFNVLLSDGGTWLNGATNSLTDAFQGPNRYLELTVANKGGPIAPRQQMVSAPFALSAAHAAEAATAANGFMVRAGDTVLEGNTRLGGTLSVLNDVTLSNTVSVTGSTTLKNGLAVTAGGATITGDVTVTGKLSAGSTVNGGWVPIRGIIMWSGAPQDVPPGWALCDGSAGTPDLRDRFVISVGAKHPASTYGGSETVVLSPDQMPSHTHQLKTHAVGYASGWNSKNEAVASSATDRDNGDSSYNTTSTGNSAPLTIMPPFYALAFIMRTQ